MSLENSPLFVPRITGLYNERTVPKPHVTNVGGGNKKKKLNAEYMYPPLGKGVLLFTMKTPLLP
jgi:hypothetical protein